MYCAGGSFTSFTAQVLPKKFPFLPSCFDSILSGLSLPLVQGLHFDPDPDTQTLPELCCKHTLAPPCSLTYWFIHCLSWMLSGPFCCSWLEPWMSSKLDSSPYLGLLMKPCYLHPSLPTQLRYCRTVPWLMRALPVLGHRDSTAHHPHGAAPFLLLPETNNHWQGPSQRTTN